jgi:hypothetical protein
MSTELSTHRAANLTPASSDEACFQSLVVMGDQLRRTGFLPSHIKDGVSFAAIVLMGREMGMGTMAACRKLQVIKGTVTERADSQLARFKSCGGRSQFKELSEARAVLWLRHPNGDEHTETFTLDDAKRAGLSSNDNYAKHPKAMLRSRAITAGLKSVGWEGAVGIYDPDEIADSPEPAKEAAKPATPSVVKVTSAAPVVPEDPMGKARLAVSRATTFEMLDAIRSLVDKRHAEGVFSEAAKDELVALIHHKAEMLIGSEDSGTEFSHEAAEHEVTA